MTKNTKSFVLPLTFIGIMFFAIGFALGINSLLVPVLQKSLGISNTASYLIIAATFISGIRLSCRAYYQGDWLQTYHVTVFLHFCCGILPVYPIGITGKLHLIPVGIFH